MRSLPPSRHANPTRGLKLFLSVLTSASLSPTSLASRDAIESLQARRQQGRDLGVRHHRVAAVLREEVRHRARSSRSTTPTSSQRSPRNTVRSLLTLQSSCAKSAKSLECAVEVAAGAGVVASVAGQAQQHVRERRCPVLALLNRYTPRTLTPLPKPSTALLRVHSPPTFSEWPPRTTLRLLLIENEFCLIVRSALRLPSAMLVGAGRARASGELERREARPVGARGSAPSRGRAGRSPRRPCTGSGGRSCRSCSRPGTR